MYVREPFVGQDVCKKPSPCLFVLIITFKNGSVLLMSVAKKSSSLSSPESFAACPRLMWNGFGNSRNGIVSTFGDSMGRSAPKPSSRSPRQRLVENSLEDFQ